VESQNFGGQLIEENRKAFEKVMEKIKFKVGDQIVFDRDEGTDLPRDSRKEGALIGTIHTIEIQIGGDPCYRYWTEHDDWICEEANHKVKLFEGFDAKV